jgi:uncharacterized protein YigA (DUF484 family)
MSASELSQDEQEALVAQWLKSCPGFFERHAEVLQEVRLKDPNSDRAISLQERQMHLLRSQNQELNLRLNEMLRFGSRNDKTQVVMVDWLQKLIEAKDINEVNSAIESDLSSVFEVEVCKVLPIDSIFEKLLDRPICQAFAKCPDVFKEKLGHLQANNDWESLAILAIPLDQNRFAGIALLSKDRERFTEDMGVFYLRQIAGLAAAALRRVAS